MKTTLLKDGAIALGVALVVGVIYGFLGTIAHVPETAEDAGMLGAVIAVVTFGVRRLRARARLESKAK